MKRRYFLTSLSAAGLLLVPPFILAACSSENSYLRHAVPQSLLSVCDTPVLIEIGRAYLEMFPDEKEKSVLSALIMRNLTADSDNYSAELMAKITEEFQNGQVVEVNGWLLSLTEARQCALYSLVNT